MSTPQPTPAAITHLATLALGYAQRLGIEAQNATLRIEKGEPSAGIPWRIFIVTPGIPGHHAPAFTTDHGFIGNTKAEAFATLNTIQWALHSALLGLQTKGIRL